MKKFLAILKWLVAIGLVLAIIFGVFLLVFIARATKDLPSVETLKDYRPPIMSRVHAGDGKLISEFKKQARVFVPIETVPKQLQHAFVAAEDQRFYTHDGFDERGFVRAMMANVGHVMNGRRLEGGSTITQQVAKNFKVGNARTVERKLREAVIARRIEKAMTKDQILELYVNEPYFGRGAYGVAAASLNYFGKPMKELSLEEIAYLAVLPKGPANYQVGDPAKKERALRRRAYVLTRMQEDGYATKAEVEAAKATDIIVAKRFEGEEYLAAEYFVEEARKQIFNLYGEDELYEGGLSIRTTLDTRLQLAARKALRKGLESYDRRRGYRGAFARIEEFSGWKDQLKALDAPKDIGDWRVALVLSIEGDQAVLGFADELSEAPDEGTEESEEAREIRKRRSRGVLKLKDVKWAGKPTKSGRGIKAPSKITEVVTTGDVILVQAQRKTKEETYNIRQVPDVNGGLIAMDPHTGRVLALVGGYSFDQSQFNRATQAYRQPGSGFKPFVYAAALDEGYTPATQVLDAPFVIERQDADECRALLAEEEGEGSASAEPNSAPELRRTNLDKVKIDAEGNVIEDEKCELFYKPANYNEGKFYGLKTLRFGLEKSKNAMTVRMANDIGMSRIKQYGEGFGIYDEVKPELAWALGAGETTMLRLATAYSMLVNGGKKIEATILDRVQDGTGKTIYRHGQACEGCKVEEWTGGPPPVQPDLREQVIDPVTAYQVTYMLKGVVDNGTGRSISVLGRPLGGKTGTTNDYKDGWFMGFSPDLVTGVYVGYDTPKPLAGEAGGTVAAPVFRDFMRVALDQQDAVPFRIPDGVTLSPVTRDTGEPSYIGAPDFILEAFRAGTEPKLGELSDTIRIGGARESFFGSSIDFNDDEDGYEAEGGAEGSGLDADEGSDDTPAQRGLRPLSEASFKPSEGQGEDGAQPQTGSENSEEAPEGGGPETNNRRDDRGEGAAQAATADAGDQQALEGASALEADPATANEAETGARPASATESGESSIQNPAGQTPEMNAPAAANVPPAAPKKVPPAAPEPEEDDLDDGLY
jgi:penicillin-binding protein 1A